MSTLSGFFDGSNLEDRSVKFIKLEQDVVLLSEFSDFKNSFDVDLSAVLGRVVVMETNHLLFLNHLSAPVSTAHSGQLNSESQILNNSIGVNKVSFTVLTLGVGYNQAARGNHLHPEYANAIELPKYVTLATDQVISGVKTFTNSFFVNSQNFQTRDSVISINAGRLASQGHFQSGLQIWDPLLSGGQNVFLTYDSTDRKFKHSYGNLGENSKTLAYLSDVVAPEYAPSGRDAFRLHGAYTEIDLPSSLPGYTIRLTPERFGPSLVPNIGQFWYVKISDSRFRVYNSGTNNTDLFSWRVVEPSATVPSGRVTMAGPTGIQVTIPQGDPNLFISLTAERAIGNISPDIGDIWYVQDSNTQFTIYNSGVNRHDHIVWSVIA